MKTNVSLYLIHNLHKMVKTILKKGNNPTLYFCQIVSPLGKILASKYNNIYKSFGKSVLYTYKTIL